MFGVLVNLLNATNVCLCALACAPIYIAIKDAPSLRFVSSSFETVSSSSSMSWAVWTLAEVENLKTLAHVAQGYSCTNSLSHYLNIRMNTSVVLEELSAHLLVCNCIGVYVTCM